MCLHDAELVRLLRLARELCLETAVRLKLRKEASHVAGVVTGARQVAATQHVRLEFLAARVAAHPVVAEHAAELGRRAHKQPAKAAPGAVGGTDPTRGPTGRRSGGGEEVDVWRGHKERKKER